MRLVLHILVAVYCLAMAGPVAAATKRVALVIGNSAYRHTAELRNPRHDATDLAAVLRGLGIHVIEGFDLDKAGMDRTIRDFAEALAGASVGMFFYAGHGVQVSGENYLVPIDAKLDTASSLDFETVRLQLVQRVMERSTETNVLFLDACRNNPLSRNLARAMGTRSAAIGRGLAPVESGVGTLISFSTQPGNVALDGTGRNSPFAGALVQQLAASRDDISTVLIAVRNTVMAETENRQVPWEHSALRARLYLREAPSGVAGPAPVPAPFNEAAQAWDVTKDSNSAAVLEAFISKYPKTVFAELARARVRELNQAGGRVASASPLPGAIPSGTPDAAHPFDGLWDVANTGGPYCPKKRGGYQIRIEKSEVVGFGGGRVGADGQVTYERPTSVNPDQRIRYIAKLSGDEGKGTYRAVGGRCSGTMVLTRHSAGPDRGMLPASDAYDGTWEVVITGNDRCPFKTRTFEVRIDDGAIITNISEPGHVDAGGRFRFDARPKNNAAMRVTYTGKIEQRDGRGTFVAAGGCNGTVRMTLREPGSKMQ